MFLTKTLLTIPFFYKQLLLFTTGAIIVNYRYINALIIVIMLITLVIMLNTYKFIITCFFINILTALIIVLNLFI